MRKSERDALDNALARKVLRQGKAPASGALASATTGTGSGNPDDPQSVMTAKGDLITGGVSGAPVRLGIGTDGQVLTAQADGTAAWEDSAGGGGGGTGQYREPLYSTYGGGAILFDSDGHMLTTLEDLV